MLRVIEGVRCGPQAHDGPAGIGVIDDLFHLAVRQFQKAREQDHQIGFSQRFKTWDVFRGGWIDRARLAIA
jgi:hypothetical protein